MNSGSVTPDSSFRCRFPINSAFWHLRLEFSFWISNEFCVLTTKLKEGPLWIRRCCALTSRYKLHVINSRGVRALVLVQNTVSNVPQVLLRASRSGMRCVGCGVNMPSFSEAPASVAFVGIYGVPTADQTKAHSLFFILK